MKDEQEDRTITVKAAKGGRRLLPGLKVGDGFMRHPFDLEFGIRTSGLIAGRHLKSGHRNDRNITAYYGVAPSVLQGLVVRWRRIRPVAPIEEFTFVDLGAGMGRAMLLASEYPFRSVVGVELNPTLARIARKNVALWRTAGRALRQCSWFAGMLWSSNFLRGRASCSSSILLTRCDAATAGRWRRALPGEPGQLDILYANNEQEKVLERQAGFDRLFQAR